MSHNDHHWDPIANKSRSGHLGLSLEELEQHAKRIAADIQATIDRGLPMLKGKGFIVIDPTSPRFDGEEFEDYEDAKNAASNVAYKNGTAIIYAPVNVMRPKREVAESSPSPLLKQLNLQRAPAVFAAGSKVADVAETK